MATVSIFALDDIAAAVAAYFADPAHAIVADVLAGAWNTDRHYGQPRVVIGVGGGFQYGEATGTRWAPNAWWDVGGGNVAPVIGARRQVFKVWAHSIAPPSTAPDQVALEAQRAAAALSDQAYAAIRTAHGSMVEPGAGDVLAEERGEFANGATLWWTFTIPIPVLGEVVPFTVAQAYGCTVQLILSPGTTTPGDVFGEP